MIEEKPPEPTRPENAIPEHHTVLEGMEEARYESGDEQDPPNQNDNSQLDSPELEPRHKRLRHPSPLLRTTPLALAPLRLPTSRSCISQRMIDASTWLCFIKGPLTTEFVLFKKG